MTRARDAAAIARALALDIDELDVDGWTVPLQRALATLGLHAEPMIASLETSLERVGPGAPVIARVGPESEPSFLILVERAQGRIRIDWPRRGETEWLSLRELADRLGTSRVVSMSVDAAMPLTPIAASNGHSHPTPLRRLVSLARLDRHDLATIGVYAAAVGVLGLTTPIAVQAMVSTVAFGTLLQPLFVLAGLLLIGLGASALIRALHTYVVEVLQRRFFVRVVADLAHRVPRVRGDAFDGHHGPELVNRFFDVFTVQKGAASLLVGGLELVLAALVGMLVLAFYHPLLLALDVVLTITVVVIVAVPWARGTGTAVDESHRKYEMASWLEELARHHVEFKLGNGLRYAEERAGDLARRYLQARRAHFRVAHGQLVAMLSLQAVASAAVLGLGGWLVINRQLTLGQLVAAELVVTAVVGSLAKLSGYLESGYDTLAGLDKLGHLADLPIEREGGDRCKLEGPVSVTLDAVHARYHDIDVLDGISLTVDPGDRLAISGHAGVGTSLLVELLGGIRAPSRGRVKIGGYDLGETDLASVRARIAVVTRPAAIDASVLDNVRMGRDRIDQVAARVALTKVGLWEELERLPRGADTWLTGDGAPLSSTQILRVTLARAIAGNPSLLVVDHLLDHLDDDTLEPLLALLTDPRAPWTLVIATHDPRVRQRCNRTLRLGPGSLREVAS